MGYSVETYVAYCVKLAEKYSIRYFGDDEDVENGDAECLFPELPKNLSLSLWANFCGDGDGYVLCIKETKMQFDDRYNDISGEQPIELKLDKSAEWDLMLVQACEKLGLERVGKCGWHVWMNGG